MAVFGATFPVLPGKTDVLKAFCQEATANQQGMKAMQEPLKVSVEQWFLQNTPMGDFLIVYLEAEDIMHLFQSFAASQASYDLWFKDKIKECCGVDLNQPLPGAPPELILDYQA